MKKSLPISKSPATPAGGKNTGSFQKNYTMPAAPKPKKGVTTYSERSTRDAGPK